MTESNAPTECTDGNRWGLCVRLHKEEHVTKYTFSWGATHKTEQADSSKIYYSKFAKDHTMFVMEQSWDGSHTEIHWKHETLLPGCDCISWVTHKLLTELLLLVIELFGILSWFGVNYETSIFGGLLLWWQNTCYLSFTFGIQQWNSRNKHFLEYTPF